MFTIIRVFSAIQYNSTSKKSTPTKMNKRIYISFYKSSKEDVQNKGYSYLTLNITN